MIVAGIAAGPAREMAIVGTTRRTPGLDRATVIRVAVAGCHGDLDAGGSIDLADMLILLAAWGPTSGTPADLDQDGDVGASDLLTLLAAWGPCPADG